MPALLTTTSRRPNASTACSTIAAPPSRVATVLVSATAPSSAASASTLLSARSLRRSEAPRAAKLLAYASPRPPPAPVMTTTRLVNESISERGGRAAGRPPSLCTIGCGSAVDDVGPVLQTTLVVDERAVLDEG